MGYCFNGVVFVKLINVFIRKKIRFALFDLEVIRAIVGCIRGCLSVFSLSIMPVRDLYNATTVYLISYYWW